MKYHGAIRKSTLDGGSKTPLKINEIFFSIQGEGSRAGLPCVFIRLHGCGLRCSWCDTGYALDHLSGGTLMAEDQVLSMIGEFKCAFVEVTGGEPLEQDACLPFLSRLCDLGYTVALETGGHMDISRVDPRVIRILDIKCPGSGMVRRNLYDNLDILSASDEVKFVLADESDYKWAREMVLKYHLHERCNAVLFAPVFRLLPERTLAGWILRDYLPVRLQLQLQNYIWEPGARGV